MDKDTKQETSPLLQNQTTALDDHSRKKQLVVGGGDRIKRDEWSEGAVSSVLEAYETKWVLRNRAKLKGQDWEEVAKFVSCRGNSTKSPKTQTQCKNKIESMKKRYRSESATGEASSWPLFPRLDHLQRGSVPLQPASLPLHPQLFSSTAVMPETSQLVASQPPAPPPKPPLSLLSPPFSASPSNIGVAEISHCFNGANRMAKEDGMGTNLSNRRSDKDETGTDSSTPGLCRNKEKKKSENANMKPQREKQKRREECDIGDSIRLLAEVVVRTENARVEAMRDLEKLRAESELKRGEMELKQTEIIANTQLEIAKIFAGIGKGVDSSLRIGRSG